MANTQIGKIVSIGQTQNVSSTREFLKRELVLDTSRFDEYTGEKRENYAKFQFMQRHCSDLDGFKVGEMVEVSFILTGRRYEKDGQTRYITDITGYKIERRGAQGTEASSVSAQAPAVPTAAPAVPSEPKVDEGPLPF